MVEDIGRLHASENAMAAMRSVLRFIQHEGGLAKPGKVKLDNFAEALGISRDQLNRYLAQIGNKSDLKERHHAIARALYPILRQKKKLPPHVRAMLSDIYGEGPFMASEAVVTSDRVIGHRALVPTVMNTREIIKPFEGLNVIVRPANEVVPKPTDEDAMGVTRGWSISVLNVPPVYVQEGDHHPLFKIRQIGQNGNDLLIEGVVIGKADRIVMQGMTLGENRTFQAIITLNHEKLQNYRTTQPGSAGKPSVGKSGLLNGVSSGGAAFGCLFDVYAIPNSTLPDNASQHDKSDFSETYEAAKDCAGVRDLDGTIEKLAQIGISTSKESLLKIIERSTKSPLLSAF